MGEFKTTVEIGDKFYYNGSKHKLSEIVDILDCHSRKHGTVTGQIYLAKLVNGLSTNTFDVAKSTVVRYRAE